MERAHRIPVKDRRRNNTLASTPFKDSSGATVRDCRRRHSINLVQSFLRLFPAH